MAQQDKDYEGTMLERCVNDPSRLATVLKCTAYITMVVPFTFIVGMLLMGLYGFNAAGELAIHFGAEAAVAHTFVRAADLIMMLIATRSSYLTIVTLPSFYPEFIEFMRQGLQRDLQKN